MRFRQPVLLQAKSSGGFGAKRRAAVHLYLFLNHWVTDTTVAEIISLL